MYISTIFCKIVTYYVVRPPKFDFEAALEGRRLKQKHIRILKKQKHLEAHGSRAATETTVKYHDTTTETASDAITTEDKSLQEFKDISEQLSNFTDYTDDSVEVSGEMTDDDYL